MHFKRLEIYGFKSFLNKTKLKFEPGVTAVVGPNGCGKSNVVDSIKWVLGEQSVKSMRSSAMQDVIFNGTEKYDPLNMAEVSLTLSNEDRALPVDYDEVTISRRLYRSGESDYLLNKMPVRLADIKSLLMGTGIGTSSYSVVEQGKMDMILSSKPEERRYLFEEASGITRFKSKKREAMLKLDRTKENLIRINDITREVERQIKAIERKARKAERYKVRYDELKELDVKISLKKYRDMNSNDSSLVSENTELKDASEKLRQRLDEAVSSLEKMKKEYNDVFNELQNANNELVRMTSDMDKNDHVMKFNKERVIELQKYVERLDWEIEEITERKDKMRTRLESLEIRFSDVRKKREEKSEEFALYEESTRKINEKIAECRTELEVNREKTVSAASEESNLKNTSIKVNADVQNAQSRVRRLKIEKERVESEKRGIAEGLREVDERVKAAKEELDGKNEYFRSFNEDYVDSQQKLRDLNTLRYEKEKRINEIKPRRQFLEKLIKEREGISSAVKDVMERVESGDERFKGVHGILSELIDVEHDYEESVEAILGDAAQAIVVEDRTVSESIVSYLSENSAESVNFLFLDELTRAFDEYDNTGRGPEGLDDITGVIMTNKPYRNALKMFLNGTYVIPSHEEGNMFDEVNTGIRVAGKKGEVRQKGFMRSVNFSDKESVSILGRREKVKQMLAEEEALMEEVREITGNINNIEEWIRGASEKREKLERELRDKQMEFADISSRRTVIGDKLESLEGESSLLANEISEEEAAILDLNNENNRLNEALEHLKNESERLGKLVSESQNKLQEKSAKREELMFGLADIRGELASYMKEEENISENLERERDIVSRIDHEVEMKHTGIKESGNKINELNREVENLGRQNEEYAGIVGEKNKEAEEKEIVKNRLLEEMEKQENLVRAIESDLESTRDKVRDVDIRKKEVEYKKSALVEKVSNTYKVDISELVMEIPEDTDWEEITARVVELKDQIEKMGEVSLTAVEEHKQLEERFTFLSKQRDDLEASREALVQAITRINRTTKKMFMETFEKIQKEFTSYFRMLFNGGKAEIILQDESNVLECGIDIVVRPPGKKLHNIMQLSGGEKAMTAIALIFAIFKVNPSPFCVLDEIDAPLDESNIVRFCNVLQDFLKLSQFVIVTHNRMTIQLADVLYGITMEEKGVSKVVSVKFSEEDKVMDAEAVPA